MTCSALCIKKWFPMAWMCSVTGHCYDMLPGAQVALSPVLPSGLTRLLFWVRCVPLPLVTLWADYAAWVPSSRRPRRPGGRRRRARAARGATCSAASCASGERCTCLCNIISCIMLIMSWDAHCRKVLNLHL